MAEIHQSEVGSDQPVLCLVEIRLFLFGILFLFNTVRNKVMYHLF